MCAHYLVVLVEGEEHLNLSDTIDVADILCVLVDAAESAVEAQEKAHKKKPDPPVFLSRLWDSLKRIDVSLKQAEVTISNFGKLTAEIKMKPDLREKFRNAVARDLLRFVVECRTEFGKLQDRASKLGFSGLLIILDHKHTHECRDLLARRVAFSL